MAVTGLRLERLLDVNPQEALPHRDVSTVPPHLPGASNISEHPTPEAAELKHLEHLFSVRTRPELFHDTDVEITIAAWERIALDNDRLLYDCHPCHITWPVREDADTCPIGHHMED